MTLLLFSKLIIMMLPMTPLTTKAGLEFATLQSFMRKI